MSGQFVSLDEAAKKLGISTDELVEMRSRGDIFGYRDGSSWKFKPEEIERVASDMLGGALDEDPAGSSILISEQDLGITGSKTGSTIGSDLKLGDDGSGTGSDSDVELVPDPEGSDVRLVAGKSGIIPTPKKPVIASADDDDDELSLASEDGDDILAAASSGAGGSGGKPSSGISIAGGSSTGSDLEIDLSDSSVFTGSEIASGGGSAPASHIIRGDSDPAISSDLELNDDDLVLSSGSDLALGNDSGINLMSPADSGISLEDEPLDLAASGISGLDLAAEIGSDVGSGSDPGAISSTSAVDFQQDEEFQLSPSGGIEAEEDSGSQVIELEDSSEFGDAAVAIPAADGFDAFGSVDQQPADMDLGAAMGDAAPAAAQVALAVPEVPFSLPQVLSLLGILLLMCMSGILLSDIVRNMWGWNGSSDLTSSFTEMVLSAVGMKK